MIQKKIYLKQNTDIYMTIYIPDLFNSDTKLRPMIIIFPGGGYSHLSPCEGEPVAQRFNSFGMNAAVVNYEVLSPYPAALKTASNAVIYARKHAEEWYTDKNKIFVCGFSAGAHLAASLGTLWNKESAIKCNDKINRPSGMILSYPVISGAEFAHKQSFENIKATSKELLQKNSIELNADAETPPAFIWHTFSDSCVPMENSILMAQAMRKNNVPFELHIFPEGCHGLSLADETTAVSSDMIIPHNQHWISLAKEWIELQ